MFGLGIDTYIKQVKRTMNIIILILGKHYNKHQRRLCTLCEKINYLRKLAVGTS